MIYRRLNGTDLTVSRLCFGAMTFGGQTAQTAASKMVATCLEAGINFFDTANVYNQGESEAILGRALAGKRGSVVLASKVRGKMGEGPNQAGLSPAAISRAVEESLGRLGTDYLDIYYLHQPDYAVGIEETLEAMELLVQQGKIRHIATSNYSSWQVCQMLCVAHRQNYKPATIAQQMYNLLARGLEQEFVPMAGELGVSIVAYNPLAGGLLTGKHTGEAITPGTRFDGNAMYQDRYWHPENFRAVQTLKSIAAAAGRSMASLSLNWVLQQTIVDSVILGASKQEQLVENLSVCGDGPLSAEVLSECDKVWNGLRGPIPFYNR